MTRFNKAWAGGLGALIASAIGLYFELDPEMTGALTIILAGLGPAVAPKNAE